MATQKNSQFPIPEADGQVVVSIVKGAEPKIYCHHRGLNTNEIIAALYQAAHVVTSDSLRVAYIPKSQPRKRAPK